MRGMHIELRHGGEVRNHKQYARSLYPPIRNSYLAVEREQPELYFPQIVRIIVSTGFFLYFSSKKKASAQKKRTARRKK